MAQFTVEAQPRSEFGNGPARRLRKQGLVPGIMYQGAGESLPIVVSHRELQRVLFSADGRASVIALSIDGGPVQQAVLTDWQLDPIRSEILHVDFRPADDVELATGVVERAPEHLEVVTIDPRTARLAFDEGVPEESGGEATDDAPESES
jgi:ribosomal protein L25 (general stress protein Ctc)